LCAKVNESTIFCRMLTETAQYMFSIAQQVIVIVIILIIYKTTNCNCN